MSHGFDHAHHGFLIISVLDGFASPVQCGTLLCHCATAAQTMGQDAAHSLTVMQLGLPGAGFWKVVQVWSSVGVYIMWGSVNIDKPFLLGTTCLANLVLHLSVFCGKTFRDSFKALALRLKERMIAFL